MEELGYSNFDKRGRTYIPKKLMQKFPEGKCLRWLLDGDTIMVEFGDNVVTFKKSSKKKTSELQNEEE